MNKEIKKPEVLYHASANKDIDILKPMVEGVRDKNEGPVVFATQDFKLATMFLMTRLRDDWSQKGILNGEYYVLVADKERFEKIDKGGAIYFLKSDDFYCDLEKGMREKEWVSREEVRPFKKEVYGSALKLMLSNGVNVYFVDMDTILDFRKSSIKDKVKKLKEMKNKTDYQNILWEIKDSSVAGKGVFALVDLEEGQNLGLAFEKIGESGKPDQDFKRTGLGAFVNHSENKNLEILKEGKNYFYITNRKIKRGEELFLDYQDFEWEGKRDFII